MTGNRKSCNKKLHDWYSSETNQVIKLRTRWAGHVTCMGENKNVSRVMMRNLKEKDHLEDRGREGRIKLKMNVKEIGQKGMDLIHLDQARVLWHCCKHSD